MATVDLIDESSPLACEWFGNDFVAKKAFTAAEIITALGGGATTVTVATIAQVVEIPAGCIVTQTVLKTVTADAGAVTFDIGVAGGQECDAGVAGNATAGTHVVSTVADANQDDWVAGDTVDVEFLDVAATTGSWILYVKGYRLP